MRSENNKRPGILLSSRTKSTEQLLALLLMANHFAAWRRKLTLVPWKAQVMPAFPSMSRILHPLLLAVCALLLAQEAPAAGSLSLPPGTSALVRSVSEYTRKVLAMLVPKVSAAGNLSLPPGTPAIVQQIYSGRTDLAIPQAQAMQQQYPAHPLGYLLEAEARWWEIWCLAAEYKYGMTMPRHKEKQPSDQTYLDLTAKAESLAEASLAQQETAEMHFYAGMAGAQASRMYSLRGENRATARVGVRAREHFLRALALDPSLVDANLGLGLYNYYVDTLSTLARVLRFVMGIPGGTKEEGIRQLRLAMEHGELTSAAARFYLAINLHNYDRKYEQALQVITPLVEQYPDNPIFLLARGDLYGKLGRKPQAIADYRAAEEKQVADAQYRQKIELLARESLAVQGVRETTAGR
jgi:tetratricopeptide (TPR) repeat protein